MLGDLASLKQEDLLELLRHSPDLLCIATTDGYFRMLTPQWEEELGYSREELLSRPFLDFVHPDDLERTVAEAAALNDDNYKSIFFTNRYRRADGRYIWLAWGSTARNGQIFAVAKNISEVKDREYFLDQIQGLARIGGWSMNLNEQSVRWTDQAYRLHDLPIGVELKISDVLGFFHPDDQVRLEACLERCMMEGHSFDREFRVMTAGQREVWVRMTGETFQPDQSPVALPNPELIGTVQDVTAHKRLVRELSDTADRLSNVVENAPGMFYQFQLNPDGTMFFPWVSAAAFEIYEIPPEEFHRNPRVMVEMVHPDDQAELLDAIELSAETLSQFEWCGRIVALSGAEKWIKARSKPEKMAGGTILWNGLLVDVTREIELEQQVNQQRAITEQSTRLAAIGELAAGVGHEINNPLAIVMGHLNRIEARLRDGKLDPTELKMAVARQQEACQRIQNIVQGLRSVARTNDADAVGALDDAVHTTYGLISEIYSHDDIAVSIDVPPHACPVTCGLSHIQQILMNLLANARDACMSVEQRNIAIKVYSPESQVWRLEISDTGQGISPAIRDKIYQTFFTTKPVGEGTGIGLAMTLNLVQGCGGKMDFRSVEGQGTTFWVDFPAASSLLEQPVAKVRQQQVRPNHVKTVVVDDEADIRELLEDLLGELNCNVATFSRAEEALPYLRNHSIDLLITDLKMPGMGGEALLSTLAEEQLCTAAHLVVLTGGVTEESLSRDKLPPQVQLLHKPFLGEDLEEIVAAAQHS